MREIHYGNVGDRFSVGFDNLICTANLTKTDMYQNYQTDICSLWVCKETGNKFGFYISSGIRCITDRLYEDLLFKWKAAPKEQKGEWNGNV